METSVGALLQACRNAAWERAFRVMVNNDHGSASKWKAVAFLACLAVPVLIASAYVDVSRSKWSAMIPAAVGFAAWLGVGLATFVRRFFREYRRRSRRDTRLRAIFVLLHEGVWWRAQVLRVALRDRREDTPETQAADMGILSDALNYARKVDSLRRGDDPELSKFHAAGVRLSARFDVPGEQVFERVSYIDEQCSQIAELIHWLERESPEKRAG